MASKTINRTLEDRYFSRSFTARSLLLLLSADKSYLRIQAEEETEQKRGDEVEVKG